MPINRSQKKQLVWATLLVLVLALSLGYAADPETLPLELADTWSVFLKVLPPDSYGSVPESLPSPAGTDVRPIRASLAKDAIDLAALVRTPFREKEAAILYNTFTCTKAGKMNVGVAADWWLDVYVNGKPVYNTLKMGNGAAGFTTDDHVFAFDVRPGTNVLVARVLAGSKGWRFVCGIPTVPPGNVVFQADETWRPVDLSHLRVVAGSALDQSGISAVPQTGKKPGGLRRLVVGKGGQLALEGDPDTPVRLRGFGLNTPWIFGRASKDPDWKKTWREQAEAARRQGYNIVRGSLKATQGTAEDPVSPENMDKFDYLASVWAENGIYFHFICNFYQLPDPWHAGYQDERRDYKIRMYLGDSVIRAAWRNGVERAMNHVNPYTGKAWKDDPVLACVELVNEQEWGLRRAERWDPETRREFDAIFRQWLEKKYRTPVRLAEAWRDNTITSFVQVRVPERFPSREKDIRTNDYLLLCNDLSLENLRWMKNVLRETGYRGLVSQYSIPYGFGGMKPSYEESQVAIVNTYYRHPSAFTSPGSRVDQKSSVLAMADYWRSAAARHFPDRPLFITEFNHSFWNPYQHECGALFGAYSALQGFDALIIHEGAAYCYTDRPLDCFSVGRSPVLRANEFLTNCFFLRGDVVRSPHRVLIDIPKAFMEKDANSARLVSTVQNKLALLTGLRVGYPWVRPAKGVAAGQAPDAVLTPAEGAELVSAGGGWAVDAVDAANPKFSLDAGVAGLRAKGLLPASNITDSGRTIFQSDTGQITMRAAEHLLTVVTPRSEAATLEPGREVLLGQLGVRDTSVPALVAACAMDDRELADSRRIVLIYSTQTANTGMELSRDRTTLVKLGEQPVLMQVGKLQATLRNANASRMALYALRLDGARQEELPLSFADGILTIELDTAILKGGPTPFFELVVAE